MRFLSIDLEATGLRENDLIIEYGMVPFCTESKTIATDLSFHTFVECPSFEELKPNLDPWVIENNETLIRKANAQGVDLDKFKVMLTEYLAREDVVDYFKDEKAIIIFGKSLNAIDLPFLTRDLGWEFMRDNFHHQVLDLSSVAYSMINLGLIPSSCASGSGLMKFLSMGDVCHTAYEDAVNTAQMYLRLLEKSLR